MEAAKNFGSQHLKSWKIKFWHTLHAIINLFKDEQDTRISS